MLKKFRVFWSRIFRKDEFYKWLKARYLPNLNRSKDLRDKMSNKLKIIEEVLEEVSDDK